MCLSMCDQVHCTDEPKNRAKQLLTESLSAVLGTQLYLVVSRN